jgi:hypothetical protein
LPDKSYGEWIIYQSGIPKYHVDLFNLEHASNRIIKDKIEIEKKSIEQIIKIINNDYKLNLHLARKNIFAIKTGSILKNIELKPVPVELIESKHLDLSKFDTKIKEFVIETTNEFINEHGQIQTLGVYTCPRSGWISMNFNQMKDLVISEYNCPDFEFVEFKLLNIDDWETEYEKKEPTILEINGNILRLNKDFGDDEFNKPFFKWLLSILTTISSQLSAIEIYLQFLDSKFDKQIK